MAASQLDSWWRAVNNAANNSRQMGGCIMIRYGRIGLGLAVLATVCSSVAPAQDFPNRQITILVGVAPGGITDITTRYTVMRALNGRLGLAPVA